jgi:putative transcriptional regulator
MAERKIVRMTLEEARKAGKLTPEQEAYQDSLTEEDIDRAIAEDPDAPDFSDPELAKHFRPVPDPDVRLIRAELDMTQVQFAHALDVPVATIRDWEQGRRHPSGPALTLLRLLERDPATMARLLAQSP